jgi:hypothetical protein
MKNSLLNCSKILIIYVLANLFWLSGCGNNENSNQGSNRKPQGTNNETAQTGPAKDNLEELLELVQLPEIPEEVVWREEPLGKTNGRVPGPTDKKLIAVLKYTPENAAKIVAIVEKNKQPEPTEIGAENWFPEELTAQAQMSGNEMLKGTAYGANQFLNTPYSTGRITRIEGTDYFVLELVTQ